ncbi:hypothetical protein CTEN210_02798 [Chaetoceros tenuissimus]|uniref:SET domain-containing protein n=1 Tax=Chaetoceros tenuissimus TaxID=426638 RepID=A0AAD3H1E6_9STRA|nr:hypothetical protein CTEN210_02798 [Chaetoceros tenuissimus]
MKFQSVILSIVLSHWGKVAAEASVEELAYPQIIDSTNIECNNNNVEGSCDAAPIDEIEFVNSNQNDTENEEDYESDEYSQYDSDADDEYSEYESDDEHSNYNSDEDSYHSRDLHEINSEEMKENEINGFDETSQHDSDEDSQHSRNSSDEDDTSQISRRNSDEEDSVYSSAKSSVYSGSESEWEDSDFEGEPSTPKQFWQRYKCHERFKHERPIYTKEDWEKAMNVYNDIMGEDILNKEIEPFKVKVETRQAGKKGRGIFAMEPIEKGTLMWSTKRTARFQSGDAYNKFLQNLDEDFACDVLQWAYIQNINSSEEQDDNVHDLRISVDLDECSFCNDGRNKYRSNMACDEDQAQHHEGGCQFNYFATRDIEVNEEILCYYEQFAVTDGWWEFYD